MKKGEDKFILNVLFIYLSWSIFFLNKNSKTYLIWINVFHSKIYEYMFKMW